jgi:3-phenylpropionate/cinnamic acid dioxygenase small subunit
MSEAEVVRFIYKEARLLDEKRFDEWYALFTEDAYYWVPLAPGQTDPLAHNSLAYEDKLLLKLRIERLKQPNAFSQKPGSRCLHVLQAPDVEQTDTGFMVRTPFMYTETRGDESQRYAATAWHTLVGRTSELKIKLKKVEILNADAALPSIQLFL